MPEAHSCLKQQLIRGHRLRRHAQEVAGDFLHGIGIDCPGLGFPRHADRLQTAAAPSAEDQSLGNLEAGALREGLAAAQADRRPTIHQGRDLNSQRLQSVGEEHALIVVGHHHRPPSGADDINLSQAAHSPAKKDARQIVIVKNERPFPAAGANDNLPCPNPEEPLSLKRADQVAFIDAESGRVAHNLNPRIRGHSANLVGIARGGIPSAQSGLSLQEKNFSSCLCCFPRRRDASVPAANHTDFGAHMLDFGVRFRQRMYVDPSQPRDVPYRMLEDRPEPARLVETLVIEADRQKAVQFVENAQHIESERRPGILMANDLPLPSRLDANANVGPAVNLHETIWAISGDAEEPARPVILEAATKYAHAASIQSGPNALAFGTSDCSAFELKSKRLIPIHHSSRVTGHSSLHRAKPCGAPRWSGHRARPRASGGSRSGGTSVRAAVPASWTPPRRDALVRRRGFRRRSETQ